MDNTAYITLSRQDILNRKMDVIANNLANSETIGFRGETPMFATYLVETETGDSMAYVYDAGIARDLVEGPLTTTGNPLDVAVRGDAYLAVQTDQGTRYTRNGHLTLNANGEIVTGAGYRVLDDSGAPILVPIEESNITIASDGTVGGSQGRYGRLKLVRFADPRDLQREADSLYVTDQAEIVSDDVQIIQGTLERSNVRPILQLTDMIDLLRAYQAAGDLISTDHQMTMRTIERLMQV